MTNKMYDMLNRNPKIQAFTLIELLISISVIGILMSILLPALQTVREKGRACVCCAQLRQWYLALACYTEENNQYIPRRGQGVHKIEKIHRPEDWFNALPIYLGDKSYYERSLENDLPQAKSQNDLFICPTAEATDSKYFMPLAMNMYLSPWIRPNPHKITEIRQPGTLVFMADSPGPYSDTLPSTKPYDVEARHKDRANLVVLDGHIDSFRGSDLGCGVGIPYSSPIRWDTQTTGINQILLNNY